MAAVAARLSHPGMTLHVEARPRLGGCMRTRLVKGGRTIAVADTVLVLPADDPDAGTVEEERVIDISARAGRLEFPSERPAGEGEILALKGARGQTVIESVCFYHGYSLERYWVRRIQGPWPEEELVNLVDGGFVNFGGTVDIRSDDVALVEVHID